MGAPKGGICPSRFARDDGRLVMFTTLRIGRPLFVCPLSLLSTNKRQEQTMRLQWRSLISFGGAAKTDRLRRCIQFIRILFREDFNLAAAADKHEWMDGAKILYGIEIWHVGVEGSRGNPIRITKSYLCKMVRSSSLCFPNLNPSPHKNAEWPVISDEAQARFGPKALRKRVPNAAAGKID